MVADDYWELLCAQSPTLATFVGDHRYDDRIEDITAEAESRVAASLRSIHARAEAIDPDGLAGASRVTRGLLLGACTDAVRAIDLRLTELRYDQMEGVHVDLLQTTGVLGVQEPDDAWRIIDRFRQVPDVLDAAMERFRSGLEAGRTPAAPCLTRSLRVLDGYLAGDLDDDVFATFDGPAGWADEPGWRTQLRELAQHTLRPAFRRYRDDLATMLTPTARPEDRAGLCWLPDGDEIYRTLVRHHTTLDLDPDELHAVGLEEVTVRLPEEYARVGQRLFATTDVPTIFERLRTDPALRYRTGDEILADARAALDAATRAMPAWFGRLPQAPCALTEVPGYLAADSPAAYYFPPAGDGSRPGTYFVNVHEPTQKNRYEAASIGYHEAIPGHHLQIAIANELDDVPAFQRFSLANTAYVEGWGLYAERLADEMGLYATDLDRIGMLAADSWRACRLVVDTGLHAFGWSRQRAIDFMATHTPVSVEEVTVEIDRYLGMPAQALAYKVGQREILRLRADARARLGDAFDIAAFHDVVLGSGAVSLPILRELVDGWTTQQAGDASR